MANTCNYRLHPRYENIPLEFGSPILVNNSNITDEYAQKLLEHNNGQRYFSQMPTTAQAESQTQKSRKTKNKSQKHVATIHPLGARGLNISAIENAG